MSRTTRRKFAQTITAASAALPVIAANLFSQTTTAAPPPPASPLAIALAGVVSAQSGRFLSEEESQRVFDDFKGYASFVERFRDFKLTNADEPDFTFHSLVERW